MIPPLIAHMLVLIIHKYGGRNQGCDLGRKLQKQIVVIPGIRSGVYVMLLFYFLPSHNVRFNARNDNRGSGAGMVP